VAAPGRPDPRLANDDRSTRRESHDQRGDGRDRRRDSQPIGVPPPRSARVALGRMQRHGALRQTRVRREWRERGGGYVGRHCAKQGRQDACEAQTPLMWRRNRLPDNALAWRWGSPSRREAVAVGLLMSWRRHSAWFCDQGGRAGKGAPVRGSCARRVGWGGCTELARPFRLADSSGSSFDTQAAQACLRVIQTSR